LTALEKSSKANCVPGKMGFIEMMWIWLAAPKHSRCIHDTLDISIASSNWIQCNHAEIYHALASVEGKKNFINVAWSCAP
jgi:hypothetical protein